LTTPKQIVGQHSGTISSQQITLLILINKTVHKLNTTHKRSKTAKQNYPGSVASYDTRPGNEKNLFYNAHEQNNSAIFASR